MSTAPVTLPSEGAQDEFALSVKVALLKQGLSVTDLARRLGYSRKTVSVAINHQTMLPRVKQRIAKELALP